MIEKDIDTAHIQGSANLYGDNQSVLTHMEGDSQSIDPLYGMHDISLIQEMRQWLTDAYSERKNNSIVQMAGLLVERYPESVSKHEIIQRIWGGVYGSGEANALGSPIKRLRHILPDKYAVYTVGNSERIVLHHKRPVHTQVNLPEDLKIHQHIDPSVKEVSLWLHEYVVEDNNVLRQRDYPQTIQFIDTILSNFPNQTTMDQLAASIQIFNTFTQRDVIRLLLFRSRRLLSYYAPVNLTIAKPTPLSYELQQIVTD